MELDTSSSYYSRYLLGLKGYPKYSIQFRGVQRLPVGKTGNLNVFGVFECTCGTLYRLCLGDVRKREVRGKLPLCRSCLSSSSIESELTRLPSTWNKFRVASIHENGRWWHTFECSSCGTSFRIDTNSVLDRKNLNSVLCYSCSMLKSLPVSSLKKLPSVYRKNFISWGRNKYGIVYTFKCDSCSKTFTVSRSAVDKNSRKNPCLCSSCYKIAVGHYGKTENSCLSAFRGNLYRNRPYPSFMRKKLQAHHIIPRSWCCTHGHSELLRDFRNGIWLTSENHVGPRGVHGTEDCEGFLLELRSLISHPDVDLLLSVAFQEKVRSFEATQWTGL